MELKGSRTEANLMAAFSGESMARNKYDFYAKAARKEGLIEVAQVFEETAKNEQAHAKLWFRALGELNDTAQNLRAAQAGEHYEWTDMYKRFEQEAREEGFAQIAAQFKLVGAIEKMHDERYGVYLAQAERDMLLRRGKAFEAAAKEAGLEIVPFDAGFFASVPCENPDAVGAELEKEGIFTIPLTMGVRISIASITEADCRRLPARILEAIEKVNK